jgi:hypothetical protein
MPRKTVWTDGQDTQIRRLRTEGAGWDLIALALGLTRLAIIDRARALGVGRASEDVVAPPDEPERQPLRAGHAATWDAINRGTSLEHAPFRSPDTIR